MHLCKRLNKQHWIIPGSSAQKSSIQEGWFPTSLFPTVSGYPLGRSPTSPPCPLTRQLLRKKLPVLGVAPQAVQHGVLLQGTSGALFPGRWYIPPCTHLRQVTHFCHFRMVHIHSRIYSNLLLWNMAPGLLSSSACPSLGMCLFHASFQPPS